MKCTGKKQYIRIMAVRHSLLFGQDNGDGYIAF